MGDRFYLPSLSEGTPITPTMITGFDNVIHLTRGITGTTKRSTAMTTFTFADSDATDKDIGFRQYISARLSPSQEIVFPGGDDAEVIQGSIRCVEETISGNLFLTVGIRIMAGDGTTVRKTILPITRVNVEINPSALTSMNFGEFAASGNYTTDPDGLDRLVFDLGLGGDPVGGGTHKGQMSFGDDHATDLGFTTTDTNPYNPWIEFANIVFPFVTSSSVERVRVLGNTNILGAVNIL
jgi:hypothetical protein